MRRKYYDEIIKNDVESGAHGYRSFVIPEGDEFKTPGSSSAQRIINIPAAFVSEDWVFVIADFSRLVRLHVVVRKNKPWGANDFDPKSPVRA
jgi:hypothetical protein